MWIHNLKLLFLKMIFNDILPQFLLYKTLCFMVIVCKDAWDWRGTDVPKGSREYSWCIDDSKVYGSFCNSISFLVIVQIPSLLASGASFPIKTSLTTVLATLITLFVIDLGNYPDRSGKSAMEVSFFLWRTNPYLESTIFGKNQIINPLRPITAYMRHGNKYITVCKQIVITLPPCTL